MEDKNRNAELNEKMWDRRASSFEKKWSFLQFFQKRVVVLLNLHEGQRFLDIGCGTGWAVRYTAGVVQNKGEFYGIDIAPKMIKKANEYCGTCENIHFYQADAENLPFENNFFDFIISTNAFHHFFNPSRVLAEVYRVLKPEGNFFLLDTTADGIIIKIIDRWVFRRIEPGHVKLYSTREYKTLFSQAGLRYISNKPVWKPLISIKLHVGSKS
jgi:ubiquinone/menaquinone biosynthesis C-methylase UbiE